MQRSIILSIIFPRPAHAKIARGGGSSGRGEKEGLCGHRGRHMAPSGAFGDEQAYIFDLHGHIVVE